MVSSSRFFKAFHELYQGWIRTGVLCHERLGFLQGRLLASARISHEKHRYRGGRDDEALPWFLAGGLRTFFHSLFGKMFVFDQAFPDDCLKQTRIHNIFIWLSDIICRFIYTYLIWGCIYIWLYMYKRGFALVSQTGHDPLWLLFCGWLNHQVTPRMFCQEIISSISTARISGSMKFRRTWIWRSKMETRSKGCYTPLLTTRGKRPVCWNLVLVRLFVGGSQSGKSVSDVIESFAGIWFDFQIFRLVPSPSVTLSCFWDLKNCSKLQQTLAPLEVLHRKENQVWLPEGRNEVQRDWGSSSHREAFRWMARTSETLWCGLHQ